MSDLVSKISSEDLIAICGMMVGVVAILGGITVAITKVMVTHYRRTQLDEMEATLKLEMVQRGMSAGEIKQVLEARMASNRSSLSEILGALPKVPCPTLGKEAKTS
ncbi:MAG TPA: hypothetical protein VL175_19535 [Pirellulales bacterium]|jgi:hypothetical protein|nr:hypothetical protein [Pirellulales bacterium]